jgi:hypothetical protein
MPSSIALLLALSIAPLCDAQAPPLGDKAIHVLLGASSALLVSSAVAALSSRESSEPRYALWVGGAGLAAATAAGALKELLDLGGFGNPELLDLLATVAGGLAASAAVYALTQADPRQASRLAPGFASIGVVLALPVGESLLRRLSARRNSASSE